MIYRQLFFYCALGCTLISLALLISGSSILNIALDSAKTIPLGTFITAMGMIAFPLSVYLGVQVLRQPRGYFYSVLSALLKVVLVLGLLWIPISYGLAGNWSFSFTESQTFRGGQSAMRWFWRLSYGIGLTTLLILMLYWISLLFKRKGVQ